MKYLLFLLFTMVFSTACMQQNKDAARLQLEIDSMQDKLDKSYKPGLDEFMISIQLHHAKLWFAGEAQNWKLADFEIGEIKETLDAIKQYNSDRSEVKSLPMIEPAIDSINNAIQAKSEAQFKRGYILLTNTCNNCHHTTQHEFNVIKTPGTPPVADQVFKP